jgi:hypothetical protein
MFEAQITALILVAGTDDVTGSRALVIVRTEDGRKTTMRADDRIELQPGDVLKVQRNYSAPPEINAASLRVPGHCAARREQCRSSGGFARPISFIVTRRLLPFAHTGNFLPCSDRAPTTGATVDWRAQNSNWPFRAIRRGKLRQRRFVGSDATYLAAGVIGGGVIVHL